MHGDSKNLIFSKPLFNSQEEIKLRNYSRLKPLNSRNFKKIADLLLVSHIKKIPLKILIEKLEDPFDKLDLAVTLKDIIDEKYNIDVNLFSYFPREIYQVFKKFNLVNANEEVLF